MKLAGFFYSLKSRQNDVTLYDLLFIKQYKIFDIMKTLLNLLFNLANIFLNSIAKKVAGCVSFAVFLALIKLGQNAKNIVEMALRLVPFLALLVRPNVSNSFLPFLTYQLQLMRKFNFLLLGQNHLLTYFIKTNFSNRSILIG